MRFKSLILGFLLFFPAVIYGASIYAPTQVSELNDVLISSPQNAQVLTYDSATGLWKNKAAGEASMVYPGAGITVSTGTAWGTSLATGIANTNAVVINAADVADNDYAKFTATGLEGRSYSEVLSDIGAQPADADLTTYAGITPTANAQTLLGETFAQMQASLSIDDLITLSGVAEGSANLGTFTGSTIADNVTNKAALQALETAVEGKAATAQTFYIGTTQVAINRGSGALTLAGLTLTPRIVTTTDDATAVIDVDVTDQYQLTAVANATEFSTTGTPTAGQRLLIRVKDAGVAKALTYNAVFRAVGITLPTTTTANKTTYIGCIYNATDSKFDCVATGTEA